MKLVLRNVKRWRDGSMVRRCVAVGILEAQRGFRRLRGYQGMPLLIKALRDAEQINRIDGEENVA